MAATRTSEPFDFDNLFSEARPSPGEVIGIEVHLLLNRILRLRMAHHVVFSSEFTRHKPFETYAFP